MRARAVILQPGAPSGSALLAAVLVLLALGRLPAEESPEPKSTRPARTDFYGDPLPPWANARLGTVRLRHPMGVLSAEFAPDSKTIASVGSDELRMWEVETGKELWRRSTGKNSLSLSAGATNVSFSADGKKVACGARRSVLLFDAASGATIAEIEDILDDVDLTAFVPDGHSLLIGEPHRARVWDLRERKFVRELEGERLSQASYTLSRDGSRCAALTSKEILVWAVTTGEQIAAWAVGDREFTEIRFSFDGQKLLLLERGRSTLDPTALIESSYDGSRQKTLHVPDHIDVRGFEHGRTSDDMIIIAGSPPKRLHRYSPRTQEATFSIPLSERELAVSPDGRLLATWGHAITIRHADSGKPLHDFPEPKSVDLDPIATFSMDGQLITTGRNLWNIRGELLARGAITELFGFRGYGEPVVWRNTTRGVVAEPLLREGEPTSLGSSRCWIDPHSGSTFREERTDYSWQIRCYSAPDRLWSACSTGRPSYALMRASRNYLAEVVAYDQFTRRLAVGDPLGVVHLFSGPDDAGIELGERGDPYKATFAWWTGFSRSGDRVAVRTPSSISIISVGTGAQLAGAATDASAPRPLGFDFSAGGTGFVTGYIYDDLDDYGLRIEEFRVHAPSHRRSWTLIDTDDVVAFSAAPASTFLRWDWLGRFFPVTSHHSAPNLRTLLARRHNSPVPPIAMSPRGSLLIVSERSGSLHAFDVRTGQQVTTLPASDGIVSSLLFSSDGRHLVATYSNGSALIWDTTFSQAEKSDDGPGDTETCWRLLRSDDPLAAHRAVWSIAEMGSNAAEFLRLQDWPKALPDEDIENLIARLDAPDFRTREAAEAQLLARGPAVFEALHAVYPDASLEVRKRIEGIFDKQTLRVEDPELLGALRAIDALAVNNSSDAAALLHELAGDSYHWRVQAAASDALLDTTLRARALGNDADP